MHTVEKDQESGNLVCYVVSLLAEGPGKDSAIAILWHSLQPPSVL